MVSFAGVPYRGLTLARRSGSRPSRHMAKKMRVWPYMITRTTLVIATTAPSARTEAAQVMPAPSSSAAASGASLAASCSGRGDADRADRGQHVEDRADDQRADDRQRQVALRVAGLLAAGRDRVEADVGEEDDRGGRGHRRRSRSARTA